MRSRAKDAIEISRKAGMKLRIAGFIPNMEYYEKEIKHLIDNEQIIYEGHVDHEFKRELLPIPVPSYIR
ncbi:MAG: hypothetical protein PWR29_1053 [Methanolobus sp.]|nr:hypothetical protein [Methanolobus sp.]